MVGVAVNVTLVPEHIVVAEALILTDGITVVVTVIVIALDVAVGCVTHVSDEVITTVTTSLFARAAFWYVALFVPTLPPFSFHW